MKYIFIINKPAGGGKFLPLLDETESAFFAEGKADRLEYYYTSAKGDAQRMSAEFSAKYGKDCIIIACGGDGTIHECANGLAHTETPLAFLPFGSGNDFSKKIYGKDADAYTAASALGLISGKPKFKVRNIDLGKVNFSDGTTEYFNGIMSLGFDTRVEQLADKISRRAPFAAPAAYKLGLGYCLFAEDKKYIINTEFHICNKTENGTRRYTIKRKLAYTLIAVCNSSYYGGGYCPAPEAKLNDGIFETIIAEPCNFAEICNLAPKYRMGVADISSKIHKITLTGGRFSASAGKEFTVNLDGENKVTESAEFSVDHKALKLCTPPDSDIY